MTTRMTTRVALAASLVGLWLCGLVAAPHTPGEGWDARAAATSLDQRITWWMGWPSAARDHGTFCISCHTALPYAMARSSLRDALHETGPSTPESKLLDNVVKRVRMWHDVEPFYPDQRNGLPKTSESRGTESILNAAVLAGRDAATGSLTDDAQAAFANMWALQMRTGDLSGAWPWLNFRYEPWEAPRSPYYGAALAALAVGTAPGGYAARADIQDNVERLRSYLAKELNQQDPFNALMALWASSKLEGLLTTQQRDRVAADVVNRQRTDGGWSTASLGRWQRIDGTPLDTSSDGYATGLVTYVLEQVARASAREPIARGLEWLAAHQDKRTGRWGAVSLNKNRDLASDAGQFMGDAATAYAVMALTAR